MESSDDAMTNQLLRTESNLNRAIQAKNTETITETSLKSPVLATFACFPELPLEIREMIWENYEQESRVINIITYIRSRGGFDWGEIKVRCKGSPLFRGVDFESRRVLLRPYKLLRKGTGIWINLSVDVIHFLHLDTCENFVGGILRQNRETIVGPLRSELLTDEDVEKSLCHLSVTSIALNQTWEYLHRFKNLKTITVDAFAGDVDHHSDVLTAEQKLKEIEAAWKKRVEGETQYFPQFLYEEKSVMGMKNSTRFWLVQSADGLWAWKHGPHDSNARTQGWDTENPEDRGMGYSWSGENWMGLDKLDGSRSRVW